MGMGVNINMGMSLGVRVVGMGYGYEEYICVAIYEQCNVNTHTIIQQLTSIRLIYLYGCLGGVDALL